MHRMQSGGWPYLVEFYITMWIHPPTPHTHTTHTTRILAGLRSFRYPVCTKGGEDPRCLIRELVHQLLAILLHTSLDLCVCVCVGGGRWVCVCGRGVGGGCMHMHLTFVYTLFFKASSFCPALTSSNERCLRYSKASTQLFRSSS